MEEEGPLPVLKLGVQQIHWIQVIQDVSLLLLLLLLLPSHGQLPHALRNALGVGDRSRSCVSGILGAISSTACWRLIALLLSRGRHTLALIVGWLGIA